MADQPAPGSDKIIETYYVDIQLRTKEAKDDAKKAFEEMQQMMQKTRKDAQDAQAELDKQARQRQDNNEKDSRGNQEKQKAFGEIAKGIAETGKNITWFNGLVTQTLQGSLGTLIRGDLFSAASTGVKQMQAGIIGAAGAGNTLAASLVPVVGQVAGVLALGDAIKGLVDPMIAAAERLDQMRTGLMAMGKAGGESTAYIAQQLQVLEKAGFTSAEAISIQRKAMLAKVPQQRMEELSNVAKDVSAAAGQDEAQAMEQILRAVQFKNTRMLRSLGISIDNKKAMEEYAKEIGVVSAKELTAEQQREALINALIKKGQDFKGAFDEVLKSPGKRADEAAETFEQISAAIGQTFLPLVEAGLTATEQFGNEIQKMFVVMKDGAQVLGTDGKPQLTALGQAIQDTTTKIRDFLVPIFEKISGMGPVIMERLMALAPIFKMIGQAGVSAFGLLQSAFTGLGTLLETIGTWVMRLTGQGEPNSIWTLADGFKTIQQAIVILSGAFGALVKTATLAFQAISEGLMGLITGKFDQVFSKWKDFDWAGAVQDSFNTAAKAGGQFLGLIPIDKPNSGGQGPDERGGGLLASTAGPDEEALAETKGRIDDFVESNIKKFREMHDALDKSLKGVDDNIKEQTEQMAKARVRAFEKMDENLEKQEKKTRKKLDENILDAEKQFEEDLADQQKDKDEQRLKQKSDYLFRMKRMEEDYAMSLADAAAGGDAKTVLRMMRDNVIKKKRAEEDFERSQRDQDEADAKSERKARERQAKQEARQREQMEKQLQEARENLQEQKDEFDKNQAQQTADMMENAEKQRKKLQENYYDRIKEAVKSWADQGGLEAKALEAAGNQVLGAMDKFYGENGKLVVMASDFKTRIADNLNIDQVVKNAQQNLEYLSNGQPIPSGGGAGGPPGSRVPGGGGGRRSFAMAEGGFIVANQPTTALFGEKEKEAALFVPLSRMDALQEVLAGVGGNGGRGTSDRMEMDIRIQATGVSAEFEAQLYHKLADAITAVSTNTRTRRL